MKKRNHDDANQLRCYAFNEKGIVMIYIICLLAASLERQPNPYEKRSCIGENAVEKRRDEAFFLGIHTFFVLTSFYDRDDDF